ncbi:MAG: NAD(+)--dinitrogen-reductase ADP-D-ribosyltransferase [Dechloromonas sp.]|nr:NAD(+)--dinitrogen-reductase ADP-D-ribosyltransferase [Dechloromonas sp.]
MKIEKQPVSGGAETSDNSLTLCRGDDNASSPSATKLHSGDASLHSDSLRGSHGLQAGETHKVPSLPRDARLPINRCNLPAVVLGGLTYQQHPSPLLIDGVAELHADLFRRLALAAPEARGDVFRDYMTVHFQLEWLEEMGYTGQAKSRAKANYVRMIRGWSFDSDSREGAVLKGWVESRFGLMPRYHAQSLRDPAGEGYRHYQEMRSQGLYGTNALEAQFDLVYAFCQRELAVRHGGARHVTLYRGLNRVAEHEVLAKGKGGRQVILLNNLSSFTCSRDRACEFGDYILSAEIPLTKIFFHCGLLPGILQGEDEFLVIGGVVDVTLSTI